MKKTGKSCVNCRFLSQGARVDFSRDINEERVTCLKKKWRASILPNSLKHDSQRYKTIAEKCDAYQQEK